MRLTRGRSEGGSDEGREKERERPT